jgi:phosphoribosylformylglycinamidine synthase subunit PurL
VEACLVGGCGARVTLPETVEPFVALFSESAARMLVTVAPEDLDVVLARAAEAGVPVSRLGVTGGDALEIETLAPLGLSELREAWTSTLPALFGP